MKLAQCTSEWVNGSFLPPGTCGADFLPSSTMDSGTVLFGTQVVLSPPFVGCGHLMRYNVSANCLGIGNNGCNIAFQLWRPTGPGVFTLIYSTMNSYNPPSNGKNSPIHVSLTFPLDMDFTADDMVGFFHNVSGIRPLEVHVASASSHSYLQWSSVSTVRNVLTTEDATTMTSQLPILNMEGNYMHVMPTSHT